MTVNRKDVIKMYRSGMTYAAIAEKVGVSRQRIQQIVRPSAPIYRKLQQRAKGKCENCGIGNSLRACPSPLQFPRVGR